MQNFTIQQIPLQRIKTNISEVNLSVLRLDLLPHTIQGNKFFKLKYNLAEAQKLRLKTLLTFGGAFSNHIYATALAGKLFDFQTIGIIRGEETLPLNPILQHATDCGMQLHYWDRITYRLNNNEENYQNLKNVFGDFYLIPEGGTNIFALQGSAEIMDFIPTDWDYICLPCGTSGTLAGLIAGSQGKGQLLGFSALKGDFLRSDVQNLLTKYDTHFNTNTSIYQNWEINSDYHFGGYAKKTAVLEKFIADFHSQYHIPLEWIYSGKMFIGIFDLIQKDFFPKNAKIVALHTGGVY